eukprot:m.41296 g.41296  ORF g.41296 m.41296 type:complete len:201 (-) comp12823_c0_seq2:867-1469(-)
MLWLLLGVVGAVAAYFLLPSRASVQIKFDFTQLADDEALELVFDGVGGTSKGPVGEESTAALSDFGPFIASTPVKLNSLLEDVNTTVYTYEADEQVIILVKSQEAISDLAFLYQRQRATASNVYAVPYQRYVAGVASLASSATTTALRNVIFVHSTGRCGSTLLSKLLGAPVCFTLHACFPKLECSPSFHCLLLRSKPRC